MMPYHVVVCLCALTFGLGNILGATAADEWDEGWIALIVGILITIVCSTILITLFCVGGKP